ncbi:MAG TPA: AgmX/PglI C-terminal domain-containing protein [Kofleriaceae bacterium]|jgi:outer membrane biosynthesis protein TonB|nr:AgmX/PglI C-terminal domain-containing protein [Kofleriaceae bacterium]
MKHHLLLSALLLAAVACGGPSRPAPAEPTEPAADDGASVADSEEDDDLEIVSTRGKIDPDVVSRALQPHAATLEGCYADQVGRRRWLGGGVEVTWDVAADGAITGVRLSSSDLGAWAIEKCVLDVARRLSFGKPSGGKASVTTPLSFSAGSGAVAWDEDQALRAVGGKPKDLARCAAKGSSDPTNVKITMYVGTRGKVQSVGFASPTGFDDAWADCAADKAMAWALTDPRGKIAKLSFVYNPAELPEEEE